MAASLKYFDALLIGKTGNGKRALGNAILLKKAFASRSSMGSVTTEVQFHYSKFEDTMIKIVDGPGIGDTKLDKKDGVKLVVDAMTYAIQANPEGYHALLHVVRYGARFTEEETNTIKILKTIFGDNFIKDHGILVMTCGDNFQEDTLESGQSFEEWCQTQDGIFAAVLSEFEGRTVLFDNTTKDKHTRHQQVRKLLDVADGLKVKGKRYTNEILQEAHLSREELLRNSDEPRLNEETIREAALITEELGNVDYQNATDEIKRIEKLRERVEELEKLILSQDRGTNKLSGAMNLTKRMRVSADDQWSEVNDIAVMNEKMQKLERKSQEADRVREKEKKREEKQKEKEKHDKELRQQQQELKKQMEELKREREELAKEREKERGKKVEKLEEDYKRLKEEQTQGWFDVLVPVGRKLWNLVASKLPFSL